MKIRERTVAGRTSPQPQISCASREELAVAPPNHESEIPQNEQTDCNRTTTRCIKWRLKMPTKPNKDMAGHDGDINFSGAAEQLKESAGGKKRVPAINAPRPDHKPMLPGDIK